MAVTVQIGPPRLILHSDYAVLFGAADGEILQEQDGLYFRDTRLVSFWRLFLNRQPLHFLSGGALSPSASRTYWTNAAMDTLAGELPEHTLAIAAGRHLDGGLHEDFRVANHHDRRACFDLELALRSDFADLFEVKQKKILQRGAISSEWDAARQTLTVAYANADFRRGLRLRVAASAPPANHVNGRLVFRVELEPGESWRADLLYDFLHGKDWREAPQESATDWRRSRSSLERRAWEEEVLKVESACGVVNAAYARAVADMAALRLPVEDDEGEYFPAAGLPWFAALFGRDILVVSLQTSTVHTHFSEGALNVLARWQARERDDYRDAEPGKIMHELRLGELAHFRLIPHTPYYGTADATPLYIVALHCAWKSTGNRELLRRYMDTALRCANWIDAYGDRDGDGFQEYETRSSAGYVNQSWKDSGKAIVDAQGDLVRGPKALCELQGYVYDAWLRLAEMSEALGEHERAAELHAKADRLFKRFNEVFWSEELGYYALTLDGEKRPVFSIASNPGRCLWSGIVPPERAARVAARLMQADMWSGWGVRTLSANHKSYNPLSYQCGSVWPHDNGFIALGLKRYGFHEETNRIAEGVYSAAGHFAARRLPELFAGIARAESEFPVPYLDANIPQGWAAGSLFMLLQAMLGLAPDAPNGILSVDPALPAWAPSMTLRNLRVGSHSFDLKFSGAEFEVLRGDPGRVLRGSGAGRAAVTPPANPSPD